METTTTQKTGLAILTPEKTDLETKAIVRDKKGPAVPLQGIYLKKPKTLT